MKFDIEKALEFAEKNYTWNYPYYADKTTKIIFEQTVYKQMGIETELYKKIKEEQK